MSTSGISLLTIFTLNSLIVALAVIIHYELLYHISILIPKLEIRHRLRIVLGVLGSLVLITWTASFLYYEMQRYWDST